VKQTEQNISYATYANIRFAQPPTGDLRYRAPQTPPPHIEGIQNGSVPFNSTNCMQSIPPYFEPAPGITGISWGSEDCLFLDVKVPEGATGKKLPVLHWFYGGGFFFGAKEWAGDPAGLFQDMLPDGEFITVSSNYRLGAHGFLYAEGEDTTPNAAILDGLAALNWTKKHIHLFGGDPEHIIVIGESAGAAMGYHLLTAHGGEGPALPFKKVVP
jgi:carboxylesterase type B